MPMLQAIRREMLTSVMANVRQLLGAWSSYQAMLTPWMRRDVRIKEKIVVPPQQIEVHGVPPSLRLVKEVSQRG
ncbi:hypothetical protein E2562_011027 [Oryza meyeriana var. granulata]|uniref:Uncharacterized protein n=1 Tax=Oryza meyeriana var. granulata TaxID=110450 RepID=A0A6G1EWD3_9ORYZ|nr:hypothetical protein E2562_011027 [Oryza meyeriana var. granulata]